MTLDKARELLDVQAGFGGFYNGNSAKLILAEVSREPGQAVVDRLSANATAIKFSVLRPARASKAG